MALSDGEAAFKATVKNFLVNISENEDPDKEDTIDEFVDMLAGAVRTWMQGATILPGTFVAPNGPVVGAGILQ